MKSIYFVILLCCSLLLGFLYFSYQQTPEPIRIGLAINFSGPGGSAGEDIRDGALLAVDEVNRQGGVNGRAIELLIRDDENSKEGVLRAAKSLIAAEVAVIIGHSSSTNTLIAYPVLSSNNILLISPYVVTTELTGKDDLFFRTIVDSGLYGKKMANWLKQNEVDSVAFLMDLTNSACVLDYQQQIKNNFHGESTEVSFYSQDRVEWSTIIQNLLAPNPDAIIMLTEATMSGIALQKLRKAGYEGLRIGTTWAKTRELTRYAGNAANGFIIITSVDSATPRAAYSLFDSKMKKTFGKPACGRSALSYELVMILADALQRTPVLTGTNLKKSLLASEYETILGHVVFDQYGDVVRSVYELTMENGRYINRGEI